MKQILVDINNLSLAPNPNINLCLGFFDGVHLGHQDVIKSSLENGPTAIMTFDVPPSVILKHKISSVCLTSINDKVNLFSSLGVECVYVLKMSQDLLLLSKEAFVEKILKPINPKCLYCGSDYRFGKNAEGNPEFLSSIFNTKVISLREENDQKISTSNIIPQILNGDMKKTADLLGRYYRISGTVIEGLKNGRKIGFPTANLRLDFPYVVPLEGVYIGYVSLDKTPYKAIISISKHPTVNELEKPIIEVHLLDFNGDLYNQEIGVQFVEYIRGIYKFKNLEELKTQLIKDAYLAKTTLK